MGFSTARFPKGEQVLLAVQKRPIQQRLYLSRDLGRQTLQIKVGQVLLQGKVRLPEEPSDTVLSPYLTLPLRQFQQITLVAERLLLRPAGGFLEAAPHRRQVQ